MPCIWNASARLSIAWQSNELLRGSEVLFQHPVVHPILTVNKNMDVRISKYLLYYKHSLFEEDRLSPAGETSMLA